MGQPLFAQVWPTPNHPLVNAKGRWLSKFFAIGGYLQKPFSLIGTQCINLVHNRFRCMLGFERLDILDALFILLRSVFNLLFPT